MKISYVKKILLYCAGFIIQFCLVSVGFCATYYVCGNGSTCGSGWFTGNNNNACTSKSSPCLTINGGIVKMSGTGNTVVVGNGTYSTNVTISGIPSGAAGAYNIVKAENIGGVIVSGADAFSISSGQRYITIQGIHFSGAYQKTIEGSYLKFLDCGFEGGGTPGNMVSTGTNGSYILFEGCYFFGLGGRYNLLTYNADHVVVRRCVIRHDGGWTDTKGDPEAATNNYSSNYVYYQNTIVIDSDQSYHNWYGTFYSTQDSANSYAGWTGCISLNSTGAQYWIDPKSGASLTNFALKNCIAYDGGDTAYGSQGSNSGTLDYMTLGNIESVGMGKWNSGDVRASNSIIFNAKGTKVTGVTISNSDIEGGGVTCSNCQTYDPQTNGLLYLPRIESNSTLSKAGTGGGRIGAQVLCKIGKDGTLYGETDWNTEYTCSLTGGGGGGAANNLWPFRNEAIIKNKFAAVSARGFATGTSKDGSSQTLTKYIWEYLGNQIPAEIYASQPPNEAPSAPENLHVVQ
jgi:hypothetical protein